MEEDKSLAVKGHDQSTSEPATLIKPSTIYCSDSACDGLSSLIPTKNFCLDPTTQDQQSNRNTCISSCSKHALSRASELAHCDFHRHEWGPNVTTCCYRCCYPHEATDANASRPQAAIAWTGRRNSDNFNHHQVGGSKMAADGTSSNDVRDNDTTAFKLTPSSAATSHRLGRWRRQDSPLLYSSLGNHHNRHHREQQQHLMMMSGQGRNQQSDGNGPCLHLERLNCEHSCSPEIMPVNYPSCEWTRVGTNNQYGQSNGQSRGLSSLRVCIRFPARQKAERALIVRNVKMNRLKVCRHDQHHYHYHN